MNHNVLYRNVIQLIAFVAVIQDISVPASVFGEIPELLDSFQKIFGKGGSRFDFNRNELFLIFDYEVHFVSMGVTIKIQLGTFSKIVLGF